MRVLSSTIHAPTSSDVRRPFPRRDVFVNDCTENRVISARRLTFAPTDGGAVRGFVDAAVDEAPACEVVRAEAILICDLLYGESKIIEIILLCCVETQDP
jgi:hypothetical protein